jgi:tripeptidyl-peptidase-1
MEPPAAHFDAVSSHLTSLGVSFETSFYRHEIRFNDSAIIFHGIETIVPPHLQHMVRNVHRDGAFTLEPRRASPFTPRSNAKKSPFLRSNPQACLAQQVDPKCLRSAYGLNAYVAKTTTTIGQCVVVNNYYKPADLADFESENGLPKQSIVKNVGTLDNEADTESTLDVQYIITTGQNVPTWWVYIDGSSPTNPFQKWLDWAAATSDAELPKTHSLSVGIDEVEFKSVIPSMQKQLMALAARGITVVFASGDSGYKSTLNYPASSPYVTAVGGVWNGDLGDTPLEVDPITTAGFSSLSSLNPIGDWQKASVASWLTSKGARPSSFNSANRAAPDLAAFDSGVYITQDGSDSPCGGTSAAAPMVSGILSNINTALVEKGHTPLGFANPFLYANADAFLDVTRGNNGGFGATTGWVRVSLINLVLLSLHLTSSCHI